MARAAHDACAPSAGVPQNPNFIFTSSSLSLRRLRAGGTAAWCSPAGAPPSSSHADVAGDPEASFLSRASLPLSCCPSSGPAAPPVASCHHAGRSDRRAMAGSPEPVLSFLSFPVLF